MIREAVLITLLAMPAIARVPTAWPGTSSTLDQWTNLIAMVNQRCLTTRHATTNLPPMTNSVGVYVISPTNHLALWPIAAGMAYDEVFTQTNAAGDVILSTNFHLPVIPVVFTNFVGWLDPDAFRDFQEEEDNTNLVWTITPGHDLITNFAFTGDNLYDLDQRIYDLINLGYFVDMKQVEDAGGMDAWFAAPREWRWAFDEEPNAWTWHFLPPLSPPLLTVSNAWKYAGLPVYYRDQVVSQHIDVAGWEVGNITSEFVRLTEIPVPVTNRTHEYLFSLAPVITNFAAELAQVRMIEITNTVTTNKVVADGITNYVVTTRRTVGFNQATVTPWTEAVVPTGIDSIFQPRFAAARTNWRAAVNYVPPGTGDHYRTILPIPLTVTGQVHAINYNATALGGAWNNPTWRTDVEHITVTASETPILLSNRFARITSLSVPTNWTYKEIEIMPPPPNWTNHPSLTGAVLSVSVTGVYHRLRRNQRPGVWERAQAWDIHPLASDIHYRERMAIVTQMQAAAVTLDRFVGWVNPYPGNAEIADPVPLPVYADSDMWIQSPGVDCQSEASMLASMYINTPVALTYHRMFTWHHVGGNGAWYTYADQEWLSTNIITITNCAAPGYVLGNWGTDYYVTITNLAADAFAGNTPVAFYGHVRYANGWPSEPWQEPNWTNWVITYATCVYNLPGGGRTNVNYQWTPTVGFHPYRDLFALPMPLVRNGTANASGHTVTIPLDFGISDHPNASWFSSFTAEVDCDPDDDFPPRNYKLFATKYRPFVLSLDRAWIVFRWPFIDPEILAD